MALSELEKQLDHKLFDRNNNRLIINEQGKRLLPLADELLARSHAIEQLLIKIASLQEKFVLVLVTPLVIR